uniref:Uncharacterized protein n=1 Tax=Steinernema glaseri TaxID=37863 RepID=A0A1I7YUM4_9BILA
MLVDFVRSMVSRKRTYDVSNETLFHEAMTTQPPVKRPCESSAPPQVTSPPKRTVCVRCANGESGHITHIMG